MEEAVKVDVVEKSICTDDEAIEKLKAEVLEYQAKVDERYSDVYRRRHWDLVEFFQKPEEYGVPPNSDSENSRARYLAEEYHSCKEKQSSLRNDLDILESKLIHLKRATELRNEADKALEAFRNAVNKADRELPWCRGINDNAFVRLDDIKKVFNERILISPAYVSESSVRQARIDFWMQVRLTASALNDCLNAIENKEIFFDKFKTEQIKREKERMKCLENSKSQYCWDNSGKKLW
jgi:hypothetical protein